MSDAGTSSLVSGASGAAMGLPSEIRVLTGLRGVLAWWVVLHHLAPLREQLLPELRWSEPVLGVGNVGVDLFFLLSGFVIELSARTRLTPVSESGYRAFLWARLARLYPVHFFQQALWAGLVAGAVYLGKPGFSWVGSDFVPNLTLTQAWGVPMKMYWNYPAWSISLEWAAYLVTPLVFAATRWCRDRAAVALALVVLWVLLLTFTNSAVEHFARIGTQYSAGVLLAVHAGDPAGVFNRLSRIRVVLAGAYVFALPAVIKLGLDYAPLAPVAALLLVLFADRSRDRGPLSGSLAHYLGRVSYSLYMSHAFAISMLHQVLHPASFAAAPLSIRIALAVAYCAAILVFAMGTYHLVEEPGRRWWLRTRSRPALPRATAPELLNGSG